MPLETAHENYIASIIEHFFVDPSDTPLTIDFDDITAQAEKLSVIFTDAFSRAPTDAIRQQRHDESDECYQFFLIATEPQSKINLLENQGSPHAEFSVADVQQAILNYACIRLDEILRRLSSDLEGVIAAFFENIHPHEAFKRVQFISQKPDVNSGFDDWEIPADSATIFKTSIRERHIILPDQVVFIQKDLHIEISLPNGVIHQMNPDFIPVPDLRNLNNTLEDEKYQSFRQSALTLARAKAEDISAKYMLRYIEEEFKKAEKPDEDYIRLDQMERGARPQVNDEKLNADEPLYRVIDISDWEGEDKLEFDSREIDNALAAPIPMRATQSPQARPPSPTPSPRILDFQRLERIALQQSLPPLPQVNSNQIPPAPPLLRRHPPLPARPWRAEPGMRLLAYKFYSEQVLAKKLKLKRLRKLSLRNTEYLALNSVQTLLKHGVIEFDNVEFLLPTEIKVLENSFYLEKILKNNLFYHEIFEGHAFTPGLNARQADMLILPSIISLQKKNPHIPFSIIKNLSTPAAYLLAHQLWLEYITMGKADINDIAKIKDHERKILINENVTRKLSKLQRISGNLFRILLAPEYSFLITHDSNFTSQLENFSSEQTDNLLISGVSILISRKILCLQEVLTISATELKTLVYANKLSDNIGSGKDIALLSGEFNRLCTQENLDKKLIITLTKMFLLKNLKIRIYPPRSYLADKISCMEKKALAAESSKERFMIWNSGFKHIINSLDKRPETYESYFNPANARELRIYRGTACLFADKSPAHYAQVLMDYESVISKLYPEDNERQIYRV